MSTPFFAKFFRQFAIANKKRRCYDARLDEARKRVLLIAASILAARKLAQFDAGRRVPATVSAIADAVRSTWSCRQAQRFGVAFTSTNGDN